MVSNSEVKKLVLSIESEMFKFYGDINQKYKAKFRSLVFNIRDLKNKVRYSSGGVIAIPGTCIHV